MKIYTDHDNFLNDHQGKQHLFVSKILQSDFKTFATNFDTKGIAISVGSHSVVGTVNQKEYENSPICSPYNLFCLYPKQRLKSLPNQWIRHSLNVCTTLFGASFKTTKFNQVVQVNNKPCDAIVYPQLSPTEVHQCIDTLSAQYPKHAILFPRIDPLSSPTLFQNLKENGFLMIPTRPVHIFHPENNYLKKSHTKRDFGLLRKRNYTLLAHEDIQEEDIERIHELYQLLFIQKHSHHNPNLTPHFFKLAHTHNWYTFFALRNPEGVIDAFMCYETDENQMACGPLGYDTSKDQQIGLYRMLFAHSLQVAHDNNYIFNFGGGNEEFKMNRGSQREIGYTAVYCKHLPLYRKAPWTLLATLGEKITKPILKRIRV